MKNDYKKRETLFVSSADSFCPTDESVPKSGMAALKDLLRKGVDPEEVRVIHYVRKGGGEGSILSFAAPQSHVFDTTGTGINKALTSHSEKWIRIGNLLIAPVSTVDFENIESGDVGLANVATIVNPGDLDEVDSVVLVQWRPDGPFAVAWRAKAAKPTYGMSLRTGYSSRAIVHWIEEINPAAERVVIRRVKHA